MIEIIETDTKRPLANRVIKKILPRYMNVAEDKLPAKFQIAKRIVVDFDKSLTTTQLWKEHEKLMKNFYETKEVIDKKKLKIEDLEIPRFSLLDLKILLAKETMKACELCERGCGVNRLEGELGTCKIGNKCKISSEFIHTGEESFYCPSHTIFFYSCNMFCLFCQNFTISHRLEPGTPVTPQVLARVIENRRKQGCRNVNFVGGEATMHLFWILEALKECQLNTPVLWNSNMFMSNKTMKILDGVVDVYLTDFKYGPDECSEHLTKVKDYWNVVTRNHLIAANQTEVTVRHLVLPNHVECCSIPILEWVANNIKDKCLVNIMDQYHPCFIAKQYPEINRRINEEELERTISYAKSLNLNYMK